MVLVVGIVLSESSVLWSALFVLSSSAYKPCTRKASGLCMHCVRSGFDRGRRRTSRPLVPASEEDAVLKGYRDQKLYSASRNILGPHNKT
eukprot:3810329-Amphidinium_carterae.1